MEEIFRTDASPILGAKCKRELMGRKISLTICGMFAYPNSFHILFLAQYSPFLQRAERLKALHDTLRSSSKHRMH